MRPATISEYAKIARAVLPAAVWDYVQGGAGTEDAVAGNLAAFDRAVLVPSALVDVSCVITETSFIGAPVATPVGIAPLAYHTMVCDEGEAGTAAAAGRHGALMVVSMFAGRSLESIATSGGGPLWLQVYPLRERPILLDLVGRAEAAGYRAIVLTVDSPCHGVRPRDRRNRFQQPLGAVAVNLAEATPSDMDPRTLKQRMDELLDPSWTWDDLAWLSDVTSLPIVLKGVLAATDATRAVENGIAGIIVSNHGGRQLDGAIAAVDALPAVVEAVAGGCEVYLAGGVRRGSDVVKALALGARGALIGRPVLWALAAAGQTAVAHLLALLDEELHTTMALCGRPVLDQLTPDLLDRTTGQRPWTMSRPHRL